MSLLKVEQASFGYGRKAIVSDVNFEIETAEFVAVCGLNGAGKTTLLKSLLGLLPLVTGKVAFGIDIQEFPLGYVPQRDRLDSIFPLSVLEVVLMGRGAKLKCFSRFKAEDRNIAEECLSKVDMIDKKDAAFFELSGGQRQRVLLARALVVQPQILFLDEPTAGTDVKAEASIVQLLKTLNHSERLAIVMISHHLSVVRSLVPMTILVGDGKAQKGPTAQILNDQKMLDMFGFEVG